MIRGQLGIRKRLRTYRDAYSGMIKTRLRWHRPLSARPHGLPGKLVVSLTSYPLRFGAVAHVLRSLLSQSVKPDEVVLWIAHEDATHLPARILRMRDHGLSIRFSQNMRSFTKIIPTLENYPDAFIVTADDDVYYHPTWLEELVSTWTGDPQEITFHRGHTIRLDDDGLPREYRKWRYERIEDEVSTLSFPTGVGGIFYPPGALHPQVTDRETFTALCPAADDVWLYWMGRLSGSHYRHTGSRGKMITWPGSQTVSLFRTNVAEDQNDVQIRRMVKRFGFPPATADR